ncbi:hypothetical protein [Massilia aerilata]|uniref:Uncharacterized protein n=1 Tax=Massilia aerilata TaxID=453817 RepID=A0ABW0S2L4_9BURK
MAIDASIIGGLKQPQFESPTNALMQILQVQHLKQGVDAGAQQAAEYQRGLAGESKLAQLLSGGGTPDQVAADLARAGYAKQALAYTKQQQDLSKTGADISHLNAQTGKLKAETTTADYDLREKKRQKAVTDIASFTSPEQALASLSLHEQAGDLAPEAAAAVRATIPQNPADFPKWQIGMLQRIMTPENVMKQLAPDANTVANNAASRANNAATVAATIRGQNLTDARAREQLAQGKVPSGYRANSDGTLVAIPGGPADPSNKAPTEFQGKSAAFGARAQQADKILGELEGQYSPAGINAKNSLSDVWLVGGALGTAANNKLSDASQRADQAQRDFVNAVLRQESGAAIGAGEFENAKKQYFPQTGDSAAVLQQKAANRKLAVQGLLNNAGHAAFSPQETPAPAAPVGPPGARPGAKPSLSDIFGH